jgi:hypothetical protein
MQKLRIEDLYTLEQYHRERADFRARVLAHKRERKVAIGSNATLYFEDRLTIQYQIQEMLRVERIFEEEGIREELEAYNPLIPDGSNLKATFMLEYPEPEQRRKALAELTGVEDKVWVQVHGHPRVWSVADEDMERSTQEKTSSVHFLRFELTDDMVADLKRNRSLSMGIDHEFYRHSVDPVDAATCSSLLADLD